MSKRRFAAAIASGLMIALCIWAVAIVGRFREMAMNNPQRGYLVLALLTIAWGALHSGTCSVTATELFKRRLGPFYRFHRLCFNMVAITTFIPVVLYAHSLESPVLFRWEGLLTVLQAFLLAVAAIVWLADARLYDMLQFLGLRQIVTGASHSALTQTGEFDTTGILSLIRHPWYLATLILVWAHRPSMTSAALLMNVLLTAYLAAGMVLEERKLLMEFGEAYREYQRRVSILVPLKLRLPRTWGVISPPEESQKDSSATP